MKKHGHWLFISLVIMLPVTVFAIVKWYENSYTPLPVLGGENHRIAEFQLLNQYGKTSSQVDWKDKIVVADFFFTHCPVVCPKMTKSLKKIQEKYAADEALVISSFSVDPERDSTQQLMHYAKQMNIKNNWLLLTGDKKSIYHLARKSFLVTATDGDGGPQDFIHSELLILVDQQKRIRGFYNGTIPAEVEQLIRDILRLKKQG